jgi:hypothetical protein
MLLVPPSFTQPIPTFDWMAMPPPLFSPVQKAAVPTQYNPFPAALPEDPLQEVASLTAYTPVPPKLKPMQLFAALADRPRLLGSLLPLAP